MVECRGTEVLVYFYWEVNLSHRHFLHDKSHVDGEKLVTNRQNHDKVCYIIRQKILYLILTFTITTTPTCNS